jgi:micrococcal nuclease
MIVGRADRDVEIATCGPAPVLTSLGSYLRQFASAILPLIGLALIAYLELPATAQQSGASAFIVVDGDTIRSPAGVKYRLLGFDAPETFYAKCGRELQLGMKAKALLEQLIASGIARIIESGRLDRYRRSLATLEVNGKDVAGVMIGEGLARPYHGERRQGWCR